MITSEESLVKLRTTDSVGYTFDGEVVNVTVTIHLYSALHMKTLKKEREACSAHLVLIKIAILSQTRCHYSFVPDNIELYFAIQEQFPCKSFLSMGLHCREAITTFISLLLTITCQQYFLYTFSMLAAEILIFHVHFYLSI